MCYVLLSNRAWTPRAYRFKFKPEFAFDEGLVCVNTLINRIHHLTYAYTVTFSIVHNVTQHCQAVNILSIVRSYCYQQRACYVHVCAELHLLYSCVCYTLLLYYCYSLRTVCSQGLEEQSVRSIVMLKLSSLSVSTHLFNS
jgi:hypothetical protein